MKSFYSPAELQNIFKISYRQIQYWDKSDFIKPSYRRKGKYRLYAFPDVILIEVARKMRASKFSIQSLRNVIKTLLEILPKIERPILDYTIMINKNRQVFICKGDIITNVETKEKEGLVFVKINDIKEQIERTYPDIVCEDYHV